MKNLLTRLRGFCYPKTMRITQATVGTKIVTDKNRVGTLLELRETPNGISAKVKLDDAKAASWYWLSQLRTI